MKTILACSIPNSILMRPFRLSAILWLALSSFHAQTQSTPQRYVVITFDDLPVVCRCQDNASRMEITDKLMTILRKYNIPALGVVNEQKLETDGAVDPEKVALLQKWLDHGHELGNHGYSHKNINEISFEAYLEEILKGERVTRTLSEKAGIPYRFYRHPYLSAGDSLQVRQDLDAFLKKHNYSIAPNTITYQDYTFSGAYETALQRGDTALAKRIRDAYLPYTLSRWETAEQQSRDLFGREIKQILMIHANRINADVLGDVAQMVLDRGYKFISIDEALEDPVYSRPDSYDGHVGVTWLSRWAAEMGDATQYNIAPVPQFVLDVRRGN